MEGFLFLVLIALGVACWVGFHRARARNGAAERRVRQLDNELQATRVAFLQRISVLEEQVGQLQAGGVAATEQAPPAEQPVAPEAQVPVEQAPGSWETPAAPESPAEPASPIEPSATTLPSFPAPEPQPLTQLARRIDWEEWIGIRGAAVLGGIVLALAAVMFLRYAVEHDLIPPIVRVAIGLATGVAAITISEWMRKSRYVTTANSLAGAGIIVLYISVWAGRVLYELVPTTLGFLLMILVTGACGALAWRHRAREIALLGLIGGFATPILLSTGRDNPIGLFGYVLLLDVGLLWLARARRWPVLMILALFGTFFYEGVWVLMRMGPDSVLLGLGILMLFGLFFGLFFGLAAVLSGRHIDATPEHDWMQRLSQIAGVWAPFVLALYFAANADFGVHIYPVAALLVVLSVAACWLARVQATPQLSLGAAAGSVAVMLVWFLRTDFTTALAWEATAVCAVLAAAFHVFAELAPREQQHGSRLAASIVPALITSLSFLGMLAVAPVEVTDAPLWPWLAGWAVMTGLALRQSRLVGWGVVPSLAAFGAAVGFSLFFAEHNIRASAPPDALHFALVVLAALGFQVFALLTPEAGRRAADRAAATFSITVLSFLVVVGLDRSLEPWLYLVVTIVVAFLIVLSATRLGSGLLYFSAVALLALNHLGWTVRIFSSTNLTDVAVMSLGMQFFAVIVFSFWPFYAGTNLLKQRWAWYGAALAGPAWFLPLHELFEARFGDDAIGLLPVVLGALSLGAAYKARQFAELDDPALLRPLVWFAAVALGFISVAIPLQLDKEWITVGWALEGFAVIALWRRLNHPGLKYFGLALLAATTIRLVANPELLDYHERAHWPIVNWLMYTYLIPAAALLGSMQNLRGLEGERLRDWEKRFYLGRAMGFVCCAIAAVAVIFTWINLTIFDFYTEGAQLTISFERMAARDLTLSLA
ncbi:MAG: DUF2339 domain-containing protein [Acidobacteria bacterium]|nr:DUF2339 domain-containing protein [Acidobacteriota bacterium]